MQAIITKYHGPGNVRGSYISAKCEAMSIRVPYDHALDIEENHTAACAALCTRMDDRNEALYGKGSRRTWGDPKVSGVIPSGEHVHVFCERVIA